MSGVRGLPDRPSIKAKLGLDAFKEDTERHITITPEICARCPDHPCIYVCPAELFTLEEDRRMTHTCEGCLECGACRLGCPYGSVMWHLPRGGFGVQYRFG